MPPVLCQTVLDTTDARALAEFYRLLLGWRYRPGDEPPSAGKPEPKGQDWLVLIEDSGTKRLAFQQLEQLTPASWPHGEPPQQLHLDLTVTSVSELETAHGRVLELGGKLLADEIADPVEPKRVYADPAGHPFCVFVLGPDHA